MTVVQLPRPAPMIWVCDCGCASFALRSDGVAECSNCSADVEPDHGQGWYTRIKDAPERDGSLDEPVSDVNGNGSIEFARARISRLAGDDDVALAVVIKDGGAIHAWSKAETPRQVKWCEQQLAAAAEMLAGRSWGDGK